LPLGGAHGVAIDAAGGDFSAPAPLDGVVEANDHGAIRHELAHDHGQEPARNGQAVPAGAAQDMVIEREIGSISQPHGAQSRSNGALAGSKRGARNKNKNMTPDRGGE